MGYVIDSHKFASKQQYILRYVKRLEENNVTT